MIRIFRPTLVIATIAAMAASASAYTHSRPHGAHKAQPHAQSVPNGSRIKVDVGRPRLLKLPRAASGIVVGDPQIADVAVYTTDTLLILGRSYGTTNVIAMDASGRVISSQTVVVGEAQNPGALRVHLGAAGRNSYECHPECRPAPSLGDAPDFQALYRPTAPGLNNDIATSASTPGFGAPFGNATLSPAGSVPDVTQDAPSFDDDGGFSEFGE